MVCGCFGWWREYPASAGQVAWEIVVAAGRVRPASGHDAAVLQFLGRPDFPRRTGECGQRCPESC